jgi:phospholipid/cholesterol/gamma-HCH transport system substrate-binding protein
VTYRSDLEQLLVLFPQGTAVMSAIAVFGVKQAYRGIYLDFNLNLNLPPPCNTGFLPVRQQRSLSDQDYPERPAGELYCCIPQDSDMNVCGVHNIPCETKPDKRSPTVELCESDEQCVPQYAPGLDPRLSPPQGTGTALPRSGAPPPAAVPYDPATGDYIWPDGKRYTQADLAHPGNKTWQSMPVPPTP